MYTRLLNPPNDHSYFLFGPRGTGKTTWIKARYPDDVYIDLLKNDLYTKFLTHPENLSKFIPKNYDGFIIIDEIQRVPELLNEVHRLIESSQKYKFILTGSSARKLRRQGVNLLAGRAYTYNLYPFIANELGDDFNIKKALQFGTLPSVWADEKQQEYLDSYLGTYLENEIIHEGMTRNLSSFYRFLEVASFSQGSTVNNQAIASEAGINSKVVSSYFTILADLLMAYFLPPFTRRAKRRMILKPKFYLFDSGIYHTIRPKGYVDTLNEIEGVSLETLFLNHLKAINEYYNLRYNFYYYKTADGKEVDFVAYGPNGFHAFEIKHSKNISNRHMNNLKIFSKDYPEASLHLFYLGDEKLYIDNITIHPFESDIKTLLSILSPSAEAI